MKPFLDRILKVFSQYRDWLWVSLLVGGIVFFMQQSQVESGRNPEDIWQTEYGKLVRPSVNPLVGTEADQATDASKNIADLFVPLDEQEIDPISYNPIFMPADEYAQLIGKLKQLRTDFQEAQDRGDIQTAIEKLRQYVQEDPQGKRLPAAWTTEPQQLLQNLVCNELVRTVDAALEETRKVRQEVETIAQTDPLQALEAIQKAQTDLEKCLADVEANPECLEDNRISDTRLLELKELRDRVAEESASLNQKLIRREYDNVVQQAAAIGPESSPEEVARTIQAILEFKRLVESRGKDVLTQGQMDRLTEIRKKVEANKASLIAQVRQNIDRIASDPETNKDLDRIQEILRQFDILRVLGESESKLTQNRRKWESLARTLEAAEGVQRIKDLLKEAAAGLEEVDRLLDNDEDPTEALKRINGYFTQIESIRKKTKGIRMVKEYNTEVRNQLRKLRVKYEQRRKAAKGGSR